MRTVRVISVLPASVDDVWAAMLRPETFLYVTRGLLGAPALSKRLSDDGSAPLRVGENGSGWVFLFHVVPLHRHTIEVVEVDPERRVVRTREHGGAVRVWNHTLRAEPVGPDATRYEDVVEIDVGRLTPVVVVFAKAFYRYRHRRWRKLARAFPRGQR